MTSFYAEIDSAFNSQKIHALHLRSESIDKRIDKIRKLYDWVKNHRSEIHAALDADLRKSSVETDVTEIYPVLSEAKTAMQNTREWAASKKLSGPVTYIGTNASIQYEPKGVSLIISPWNYPFNLTLCPLISALAAGCTAIIKPSELSPNATNLLGKMTREIFAPDDVFLVNGGVEMSKYLLLKPYDHIFFTGSTVVGSHIMRSAADHLCSVTLEMGGKCPVVVMKDADVHDVARKVVATKFINSGQTCIAPDYVLVPKEKKTEMVQALKTELGKVVKIMADENSSFSRIINQSHFERILGLLDNARSMGAATVAGGNSISSGLDIEPTILVDVSFDMKIMQEEIFGPVLPIVEYGDLDSAIMHINTLPKPLAVYAFSKSDKILKYIFERTSSGGAVANDCVLQFMHPNLPFGGAGNSGIGRSHGYAGFLEFTNQKSVLRQRRGRTAAMFLLLPYTALSKKITNILLKFS